MSVLRPPRSRQKALDLVVDAYGIDLTAEIAGISPSYVRRCTNPEDAAELSHVAAARISRRMREDGKECPLRAWYDAFVDHDDARPLPVPDALARVRTAIHEVMGTMQQMESHDPYGDGPKPRVVFSAVLELGIQINSLLRITQDANDREIEAQRHGEAAVSPARPKLVSGGGD